MSLPLTLGTMTVQAVQLASATGDFTKEGISVDSTFKVWFTGTLDILSLMLGATSVGMPMYGSYLANSLGTIYCSKAEAGLINDDAMANPNAAANEQSIAIYKARFSPIGSDRLDLPPLSRPVQIEGGGIDLTEVRRIDVNGKPMVNAAGDYFEGLPNFYIPGGEFTLTRNEASNPSGICQSYSFSQNQDSWYGINPGNVMLGKITFRKVIEKYAGTDVTYYPTTYPFRIRTDQNGWNFCPLNYGYRYKPQSGKPTQAYMDSSGTNQPVFLAADGTLLNPDGSATPTAPIVFPAATGSGPGGYVPLVQQTFGSLGLPDPATL